MTSRRDDGISIDRQGHEGDIVPGHPANHTLSPILANVSRGDKRRGYHGLPALATVRAVHHTVSVMEICRCASPGSDTLPIFSSTLC